MTLKEVMDELAANGSEQTRKVLLRHGAREPFFGVKVEDLKKIRKKTGKDHGLALDLFNTGNSNAMYLASMICDPSEFSMEVLDSWAARAYWYMLSEYAVAPVAAQTEFGESIALKWIGSDKEMIAAAGWATLSNILAKESDLKPSDQLLKSLLSDVQKHIHIAPNRVRYTMNGFIIATGSYVDSLHELCKKIAGNVGKVNVDMGGTACKVPDAVEYIQKVRNRKKSKKQKI
jgi:3-methyladenine DNA glycosylase AlkD